MYPIYKRNWVPYLAILRGPHHNGRALGPSKAGVRWVFDHGRVVGGCTTTDRATARGVFGPGAPKSNPIGAGPATMDRLAVPSWLIVFDRDAWGL
ncbi:hypothetical protein FI98_02002 [Mycobacterium tuberculosis]|nr:hypothetical protein FI98_02002 [Mycobacterium tuberculosis]